MKPILIFDGDCGFCRRWVARWKMITGERVDYAPFQEVSARFPEILKESFARSVMLIDENGKKYEGAEAVFRVLNLGGKGMALGCYERLPPFRFFSEFFYRFVASHRTFFSALTRFFWGRSLEPATYGLTHRVYFGLLGAIYFFAFASLALQLLGLWGVTAFFRPKTFYRPSRFEWGTSVIG
jgi:predicted DCC family thiol-disulfide oxidoreductase YuxK